MHPTMDEIRAGVLRRVERKLSAIAAVERASSEIGPIDPNIDAPGRRSLSEQGGAIGVLLDAYGQALSDDLSLDVEQLGFLIARDVIAPVARESGDEPVAWLTGNSYFPAIRDLADCESVWQADQTGETFAALVERIEQVLDAERVYLGAPEYDNALYVVDLARFRPVEADGEPETLSDEWERIEP